VSSRIVPDESGQDRQEQFRPKQDKIPLSTLRRFSVCTSAFSAPFIATAGIAQRGLEIFF